MKFAKELDQDLVPEWRVKYLDYREGKKKVKRVARAIQRANATPSTPGRVGRRTSFGTYGTMSPFSRKTNARGEPSSSRSLARDRAARPDSLRLPDPALSLPSERPPGGRSQSYSHHEDALLKKPKANESLLRRLLPPRPASLNGDIHLEAIDQVRSQQKEFFGWMESELDKIESFYKLKETQAGERLQLLRDQLHVMRDRRIDELQRVRQHDPRETATQNPFKKLDDRRKLGPNSKALVGAQPTQRDYVRRPTDDISYRAAKRKLKLAMQEFYRGLELLKSYALLNRTAFRKINKKYDKAVNAWPPLRFTTQKVNKAWFVESDVVDSYIKDVEDLYARYFEGGNHKVAVGKLRSSANHHQYSATTFRNGLALGVGSVFAIQGLVHAVELLNDPDSTVRMQTSYLLQIYGGYFLAVYLLAWFCIDCGIWKRQKINFVFVFEFDPRHHLDWRQLSAFPAMFFLLLGFFLWINFARFGSEAMYIYYPIFLIASTAIILFLPAPVLHHRARKWFAYSQWRLFLAGLYPVEFRDFFLGDMYCSLTYLTSNIELFFCLYAKHWNNPGQCNSTHSRLLGFFSTLPGIWRALQCLRRYYDTRNAFPHLVNCGKYLMTILYYVSLSLFRIQNSGHLLALFVTFATINAVYCSIWDVAMDWSLCQPYARKKLLRNVRGYKNSWWYYAAMVIDPILRFNWIPYIVYTHDVQHSTVASFMIAFSEVTRRGIWVLFRVENEHCANVAHFKASRDVPLPYTFESLESQPEMPPIEATTSTPSTLRRRPRRALTSIVADAHTQDFEKKRKPADVDDVDKLERDASDSKDSDEEAVTFFDGLEQD